MRGRRIVGLAAALAALAGGGTARSAPPGFRACASTSSVLCGTVTVPLDRSGAVPGTVPLHVEVLPPGAGTSVKRDRVVFVIAGGPGQGSAQTFELRDAAAFWRFLFPGYTIVAYDDRGTGRSGRLSCPNLTATNLGSAELVTRAVAVCGHRLGDRSSLYSSRANAADLDAVRRAVGVSRVTLFGVSYGTKQALGYALRYPTRVARLVLDSVAAPTWPEPFAEYTLRALPHGLDELCRDACRGVTTNAGADFAELANRLAASPVDVSVPRPGRSPDAVHVDGLALLQLGIDTDLNPGIAAELPAAVQAGLDGNLAPLERLVALEGTADSPSGLGISAADYVAVSCSDGRFPWAPASAVAGRPPLLAGAVAALPPDALGRFGPWAAAVGSELQCEDWPPATGDTSLPAGPMPDVPVLILSGGRDIRTPTAEARAVAAMFRHARVVVVGGSGHAVTNQSVCADQLIAAWVQGEQHGSCPRVALTAAPLGPFPGPPRSSTRLTPARTLALVVRTLDDAEAFGLASLGADVDFAGLAGGSLRTSSRAVELDRYADVGGIALTGLVAHDPFGSNWTGGVVVRGSLAAAGVVTIRHGRLTGTLGGTRVTARVSA